MALYPIIYNHPLISFLIYSLTISIVISLVFGLDDYLSWEIKDKPRKERFKIKVIFHFLISFLLLFIVLASLYYLFGFGSNLFPICSYKKFCKN